MGRHIRLARFGSFLASVSVLLVNDAPLRACPTVSPCVPSACFTMHPNIDPPVPDARSAGRGGGGGAGVQAFNSRNVTLLAQVPLAQMGGGTGASLYGWTDPLTRREYAVMSRSNGTAFIDVTNPTQPVYVANLPKAAGTPNQLWREPKVYQNTVYVGVDGTNHPMQVMDLTKLRSYAGTTMNLAADFNYRGAANSLTNIHTIAVNHDTGYLYAAGTNLSGGGLHVIDVRNPLAPVQAGGYALDGYTHETQVVTYHGPDLAHRGKEIAFNSNGKFDNSDSVSIVDVSNKSNMVRLSARGYPNVGYIHQGWLTEDHRYFFQNDEFDENDGVTGGRTRTHLWDVSDLDNPRYRGFYDQLTTSVDHNLYVKDGFLYQTNYTTGLRVFKIGNLESTTPSDWLTEVAFFDTYMANDGTTYNGAWNNYPYFASGNVIVSDIDGGLFVLRPNLPAAPGELGPIFHPRYGIGAVPEPASALAALCAGALALGRFRPSRFDR